MKLLDKVKELKAKYLIANKDKIIPSIVAFVAKRLIDMQHIVLLLVVNKLYLQLLLLKKIMINYT